jgi:hypothetical protein
MKHVGRNPSTDGFGPGLSAARPYATRENLLGTTTSHKLVLRSGLLTMDN